ncbi:AAA family ATPase [Nocardioides ultimimeridianus]
MTVDFAAPAELVIGEKHHVAAAVGNKEAADAATATLLEAVAGTAPVDRVLLKAAAGAGKSYALSNMVTEAVTAGGAHRVAIVAFTRKQTHPLATSLAGKLGKDDVCLFVAKDSKKDLPDSLLDAVTVVESAPEIPKHAKVVIATCSKLGAIGELRRQIDNLGTAKNGKAPYDVLFVDEAWQIPHHLFDKITGLAPVWVGVGDVGQLPPLEVGQNPWRGDARYNPYRAWPTEYDDDARTWARELPAVWRPAAGHLGLWRAFYPEWTELNCVAADGDRWLELGDGLSPAARTIWEQVGTGVPTLLEVDGLPDAEAADVDLPLMNFVEDLLDELFSAGFRLAERVLGDGDPTGATIHRGPGDTTGDPLVAVLATRNQAVDDAAEAVTRLAKAHDLTDHDLLSSTVDSYQGQTNGITVAIHPLTGATELDEFNSAFGRLAVTCTRATHGLLMLSRPGLDTLLAEAPARPGTPFGEPGNRQLPRQTHLRILATFARGSITVTP